MKDEVSEINRMRSIILFSCIIKCHINFLAGRKSYLWRKSLKGFPIHLTQLN